LSLLSIFLKLLAHLQLFSGKGCIFAFPLKLIKIKAWNLVSCDTIYNTRRKPLIGRVFDNSKGKIGKQLLENRLNLMDAVKFDWISVEMTDDRLRKFLNQTFFDYWLHFTLILSYQINFCKVKYLWPVKKELIKLRKKESD